MNKTLIALCAFAGFCCLAVADSDPQVVIIEKQPIVREVVVEQPVIVVEQADSCKMGTCNGSCPENCRCKPICLCVDPHPKPQDDWVFFQLGILPGIPSGTDSSNVYGIKSGWPIVTGDGRVRGIEASWLWSGTSHVDGIQASWVFCMNRLMNGIMANFVTNINTGMMNGVQATFGFNRAGDLNGLQASSFNYTCDVKGFQAAAIGNITGDVIGFQASVVYNQTGDFTGFQTALINNAEEVTGLQVGLINLAKRKGFQFGLLNFIEDGWLPFFPVVNFCF